MIKGQGDRLEGGSVIGTQDMKIIDSETDDVLISGIRGSMLVHYEPANLLPVFSYLLVLIKIAK